MSATETEHNRELIHGAFVAWQSGTAAIASVFAPEMTWRIEGHSRVSRDYADTNEFITEVLAPFALRFTMSDPFRPVRIRGVYADGDMVIVLWDGHGTTLTGTPYENSYAWFMRLREGEVVEANAFHDSVSSDRLWSEVAPLG